MLKQILLAAMLSLPIASAVQADALKEFDVAEDHTRFIFAPEPVHDNGMPAHGNPFVTQGYIYPAGTVAGKIAGVLVYPLGYLAMGLADVRPVMANRSRRPGEGAAGPSSFALLRS